MGVIILGIICIYLCFKLGDWKNWKLYYPTILYYIIGDLTSNILTYNKPLWLLRGFFWKHTFTDYFVAFVIFPCIIILFLSNYPKQKKVIYIAFNVFILSSLEYIANVTGRVVYYNGWNYFYTILFYSGMFPLLRLHFKKPILAWLISMVLAFFVAFIFKIPLKAIR